MRGIKKGISMGIMAAVLIACFEAWCYSSTHHHTLILETYTQGSCAVFYYDADGTGENLYPYYVLVVNKN